MKKLLSVAMLAVFLTALSGEIWQTAAGPQILTPFPLSSIRLTSGSPWYIACNQKIVPWLVALPADNVLYIWRQQYGFASNPGSPLGCWEAPGNDLRGHMTGHILSSLGMAYAVSGNATLLSKLNYIVRCLDTCQSRAVARGMSAGCLSAYGEAMFTSLENNGCYGCNPNVWAPWYTQHKVLAGLIKCYLDAGDTVALRVAKNMGIWAYNRLSKLTSANLQSMWSRYIAGEYGGYNESAAELYMITGDVTYRNLARLFNDSTGTSASLTNLISNSDRLANTHANMYMPRIAGYLRDYDADNSAANYYNAAANFFTMLDLHHLFRNGGCSGGNTANEEEFMPLDGESSAYTQGTTSESCPSNNALKLAKYLYYHDPQSKYYDHADRQAFNRLLYNYNVISAPTNNTSWSTYFHGVANNMGAGVDGQPINGSGFTCCGGTCLEAPMRFAEGIYAYRVDTLFINTFIPSTLTWAAKNVTVTMATAFPEWDTINITIAVNSGTANMPVKIRAPWWKKKYWRIWIGGTEVNATNTGRANPWEITPGSNFTLPRTSWTGTTTVKLSAPQTPRFEVARGSTTIGSIMLGPMVMTRSGTGAINAAGTYTRTANSSTISMGGVTLTPWYKVTAAYTTYVTVSNFPDTTITWEPLIPIGVTSYSSLAIPVMAAPTLKIVQSQIRVSFVSPMARGQTLRVQLFNARGAMVADLSGTMDKGTRSMTISQPKAALPAGVYLANVTVGGQNYRTSLVYDR